MAKYQHVANYITSACFAIKITPINKTPKFSCVFYFVIKIWSAKELAKSHRDEFQSAYHLFIISCKSEDSSGDGHTGFS